MRKITLFNKHVTPACRYCEFGKKTGDMAVVCEKRGVVSPYFRCLKFRYDPIKREPKRNDISGEFTPEQFEL